MLNEKHLHAYSMCTVSPQCRERVESGLARQIQRGGHLALCESVSVQSAKASAVQDFFLGRATWAAAWGRRAPTRPEEAQHRTMLLCSLCCTSTPLSLCLSLSVLLTHTLSSHTHTLTHTEEFSPHSWKDRGHWLDAPSWALQCSPSLKHTLTHVHRHTYMHTCTSISTRAQC